MTNNTRSHTVPNTDVTVSITYRPADKFYTVTRNPGTAEFVNYLSCGRSTYAEAAEQANFLWSDTVTRRDAWFELQADNAAFEDAARAELAGERYLENQGYDEARGQEQWEAEHGIF